MEFWFTMLWYGCVCERGSCERVNQVCNLCREGSYNMFCTMFASCFGGFLSLEILKVSNLHRRNVKGRSHRMLIYIVLLCKHALAEFWYEYVTDCALRLECGNACPLFSLIVHLLHNCMRAQHQTPTGSLAPEIRLPPLIQCKPRVSSLLVCCYGNSWPMAEGGEKEWFLINSFLMERAYENERLEGGGR